MPRFVVIVLSSLLGLFVVLYATVQALYLLRQPEKVVVEVEVEVEVVVEPRVHVPWQTFARQQGYTPVEALRGVEQDKMGYVIGSGATLDAYPDTLWSSLRDDPQAVIVGINQVHLKVGCDYVIQKDGTFRKQTERYCAESGCKLVLSQYEYGNYAEPLSVQVGGETADTYMFAHTTNCVQDEVDTAPLREMWPNYLVCSHSTVTSAFHLACMMGCARVVLLGCDMGTVDGGRTNFEGYKEWQVAHRGTEVTRRMHHDGTEYARWLKRDSMVKQVTDTMAACEEAYGTDVVWAHPYPCLQIMVQDHADAEVPPQQVVVKRPP